MVSDVIPKFKLGDPIDTSKKIEPLKTEKIIEKIYIII